MRFVIKKESDKTVNLASTKTYDELLNICLANGNAKIKDSIYRDSYEIGKRRGKRSHVEDQLNKSYHHKCAYCERNEKADIEHYRPKGAVSDAVHDGYYWLCYEWTNLLPACANCNRNGAKGTLFPIFGTRVKKPKFLGDGGLNLDSFKANATELLKEKPYLLHPEIDKPEVYFKFEVLEDEVGILIDGIDDEKRGETTIEICLLNREEVVLSRQRMIHEEFIKRINAIYNRYGISSSDKYDEFKLLENLENEIIDLAANSCCEKATHTHLRKYITSTSDNFKQIVGPFILEDIKELIFAIAEQIYDKSVVAQPIEEN